MSTATRSAAPASSPAAPVPSCLTCNDAGTIDNVPYPVGAKHPTYHDGVPCWACQNTVYQRWVGRQMSGR